MLLYMDNLENARAASRPHWGRLSRLFDNPIVAYITLLALQIKILWGAWTYWDLPAADASRYFMNASDLVNRGIFPTLDFSPGFAAYYSLYYRLFDGAGLIYQAHRFGTILLVTALFYAVMRRLLGPTVAWLATAFFILIEITYTSSYVLHVFILVPMLIMYAIAHQATHWRKWSTPLLLVVLVLTITVRPEYALVLPLFAILLVGHDWLTHLHKSLSRREQMAYAGLVLGALGVGAVLFYYILFGGARSAYVVSFAHGMAYLARYPDAPYTLEDHYTIYRQVFGDEIGLLGALRSNPAGLWEHTRYVIEDALAVSVIRATQIIGAWRLGFLVLGAILLGAAIKLVVTRCDGARTWLRGHAKWVIVALTLPFATTTITILYPVPMYYIILQVPLLALVGLALGYLLNDAGLRRLRASLPVVWIVALLLYPTYYLPLNPSYALVNRIAVEQLQATFGDAPFRLLTQNFMYCRYVDANCTTVWVDDLAARDFLALLEDESIDAFIVEPMVYGAVDPTLWAQIEATPEDFGYQQSQGSSIRFFYRIPDV